MDVRRVVTAISFFIATLCAHSVAAQTGPLTGTWSGSVSGSDAQCPSYVETGQMTMILFHEGTELGGVAVIEFPNPPIIPGCTPGTESEIVVGEIVATASENSLRGELIVFDDEGVEESRVPISGMISGASMSGNVGPGGFNGTFTLTKEADTPFSGFWNGNYQFSANECPNPPFTGRLESSLFSYLGSIVGPITFYGVQQCGGSSAEVGPGFFFGQPSGNTLIGEVQFDADELEGETLVIQATLSGNTMSGTLVQQGGDGGNGTFTLTRGAQLPEIVQFDAQPATIRSGGSATLVWSTRGAASVSINNGVGAQPTDGAISVSPTATTTYTLTATNSGGSTTATVTVNVITIAAIQIGEMPRGILQEAGAGGSDQYVLTNSGGASTTIALQQQGGAFFTQAPTSFTLAPGQSQIVTITTSPQPPGAYEGLSIPTGTGVPANMTIPIRALSTAPPAGVVNAVPSQIRVDVVAPPEGNPPPGSARFTNNGGAALNGILVSDAPWLIPQSGIITIPAGGAANVSFTIDRSRRPDAGSASGSVIGTLTLVYLSSAPSGKRPFNGGSVTVNTPVGVTDTAASAAGAAVIPPIAGNEIAFFVPGVRHQTDGTSTLVSDLGVANLLGSGPISSVRLYYSSRSGIPPLSLLSTISQIAANQLFGASNIVKTLFGNESQVGTAQVRASAAARLAVSATLLNTGNPAGTVGTVLPVVRSDRDVGADRSVILTGLRSETGAQTDLYLQETSGQPASVQVQFYNADGAPVGAPRNEALESFRLLQLTSAAPAGAVAAQLTASSTTNGEFSAYATSATAGGELWSIVDWSRHFRYSQSDSVVIPIAGSAPKRRRTAGRSGAGAAVAEGQVRRTDVAVTNTGSAQASGTLKFYSSNGQATEQSITLDALQTRGLDDIVPSLFRRSGGGYIVFTPTSGSFAVTSRSFTSATYGSSVPVLAAAALKKGETKRIIGVHDAAQESITARKGGTFRTDFGIIETSGSEAKVRVTLHYTYPAGNVAAVRDTASREYTLAPRQMMYARSIAREIIGAGRESAFGDLSNLQVEFSVVDGGGAVIPYTISFDNGTADAFVRVE